MRKRIFFILILFILLSLPTPVYARAGGGGGSSGGAGSGSSGHSSSPHRSTGPYSPIVNVIQTGAFCLFASAGSIIFSRKSLAVEKEKITKLIRRNRMIQINLGIKIL